MSARLLGVCPSRTQIAADFSHLKILLCVPAVTCPSAANFCDGSHLLVGHSAPYSLLQIFDAKIRFIFGLGITQVVDAIGHGAGQNGMFVTIAVDGIFIVMLILCSRWAKAGSQGAFLGGMIAYALDGVLLLVFNVWLDAAVHA